MTSKTEKGKAVPGPDAIVDAAIALAEEVGWDGVRLRIVARRLGIPLTEVRRHFRDQDAIANAWFQRALHAMLDEADRGLEELPATERVTRLLMGWFEALKAHRRVSVEMIRTKMYPPHPHHWVPGWTPADGAARRRRSVSAPWWSGPPPCSPATTAKTWAKPAVSSKNGWKGANEGWPFCVDVEFINGL